MKTLVPLIRISTKLLLPVILCWATSVGAQLERPTNLRATLLSNGSVYLTWTDNAQGENGYNIYKQKQNPGPYVLISHGTTPDQNSYVDSSALLRGKTYWYFVAPYRGSVEGKKSNKVQITIGTPPAADAIVNTLADHDDGTCGPLSASSDCTLREAIRYVPATGKVAFASGLNGTIQLDPNLGELAIGKSLTVQGPGASSITVSGNNAVRVFSIGSATVTLSGLTIANGSSGGGSAISNLYGTLTINRCVLSANSVTIGDNFFSGGGAIYNYAGNLTVTGTTLSTNSATATDTAAAPGGAILNDFDGTAVVSNSTLSDNTSNWDGGAIANYGTLIMNGTTASRNTARQGGGIANYSTSTVNNSKFSGNQAQSSTATVGGGAIYNNSDAFLSVNNTTFDNNSAPDDGGGIYNYTASTAVVANSTFSKNGASYGGGIRNIGTLTLTNSTLSGNSGVFGGGGIHNYGTLTVSNCTVYGNDTGDSGGGIATFSFGTLSLSNSIVAGNIAFSSAPDLSGTVTSGDYNLVQETDGATLSGAHNVTGQSPNLGPLQNNGGLTKTHALLSGSPAINAGSNALIPPDY